MARPQLKFADASKNLRETLKETTARCRHECEAMTKRAFWVIRQSDARMAKANHALDRAMSKLKLAGKISPNGVPKSDPDLAWGELVIHGTENPKRRASD